MPDSRDALDRGMARRRARHADQATLLSFVVRRGVCDATGEPLDPRKAVAMMVTVEPGVSRFAVVTAAHWDGGEGALSSADPAADKDVLDGRRLFGDGPPPGALTRDARAPRQSGRVPLLQQPRAFLALTATSRRHDVAAMVSGLPEAEPPNGQWLARQCAQRPRLIAAVETVIRDPYGTREAPCSWQDWYAGLQLFENAARRGLQTFTVADYRWAGAWLESVGSGAAAGLSPGRARQLARLLRGLGSYADDQRAYRLSWEQRYASKAPTAAELAAARQISDGHVRFGGRALPGIDGSGYALAVQRAPGKARGHPVVVVTNSAGHFELVPFPDLPRARGWLASRLRGASGPMIISGPATACRASCEDELLGWLIHAAYGEVPWDQLATVKWTTHLRAELFLALAPDGRERPTLYPGESPVRNVRRQLASRLAFAPGWAADSIGWPGARRALAYFDRLLASEVTESHALRVASGLAYADGEAAMRKAAADRVTGNPVRRSTRQVIAARQPQRRQEPRRHGVQPWLPKPTQAGLEPRR